MSLKKILIVLAVVLVGAIYYYLYGDYFKSQPLEVSVMARPRVPRGSRNRPAPPGNPEGESIMFSLNGKYKLTSVQVIPSSELLTNKYAHPIWHLVSTSNSVPVEGFTYGMNIHGMHPEVKGATAEPLEPGAEYHVIVEAGKLKGEHVFKTPP